MTEEQKLKDFARFAADVRAQLDEKFNIIEDHQTEMNKLVKQRAEIDEVYFERNKEMRRITDQTKELNDQMAILHEKLNNLRREHGIISQQYHSQAIDFLLDITGVSK